MADKVSDVRQALIAATRKFRRSETAYKRDLEQLRQAIMAALRAGETKSQIARDTGYTREYVTELIKKLEEAEAKAAAQQQS